MPKFNLKTMKLFGFVLLPIFIIGFFVVNNYFANAQVPDFINYKGRLTNSSDEAITSATTIQFSLYNSDSTGSPTDIASSGGPLLWKEVFDQASGDCVKVTPNSNGYFSVKLGSCEAFPAYLTFNSDLYLGIKIGSDSEASPRIKLGAHPFARNSATVNTFSATSTATAGQLLALDDDLGFNINTGSYSGASFTMSSSTATSSIVGNFSVSGDMFLAGSLFDNSASAGAIGMVLQSTGSGLNWVATSSLGIKVGGLYGINSESLATDKTLVSGVDDIYQYLDPNGVNRNISLDKASASAGDRFVIKHNGSYDSSYYLIVKNGAVDIDWVYADAIKEYIFNGSDWVSTESGAGYNVAIGPYVSAINEGTAVGWGSWADNFGTALGISAYGKNEGVAVGYAASGDDYGVGIGYAAYGDDEGVGIGYASSGNASGTAVGYIAAGANQGVAIGYSALGSNSGVAVGYSAEGDYSGVAVGYLAKGDYSGVALGYEAQGYQHGVAIGYQAGLNIEVGADRGNIVVGYKAGDNITTGSKNILIGYDVDAPSATSANTLNIGNLLFGTGIDGIGTALSSGNVGIGTSTPWKKLSVAGDVSITGALFDSNSASGTAGMVLQSTGSGTNWVNTSSLGIEVGGAYGINVETLTGHKTLTPDTDEVYQYLNPNGANRDVTLDTASASAGNRFVIKNNGTYTISYYLTIKQGLTAIEYIYAGGIKEFVFDGTNWVSADNGSGDNDNRRYNVSIGYAASGYGNSVAIGYAAKGYSFGVAVGPGAEGYSAGAVLGYTAKGYSDGVAIGYGARGMNQGVAIGYDAGRNISTTGNLGNIVIGYQAGDNITSGSKNIVIGYNIDAPSATSANTLNIGNLLFGTGIDGTGTTLSSGNIGIGTSTPTARLEIQKPSSGNILNISSSTAGDLLVVDSLGSVGIGTSSPWKKFSVAGDVSITGALFDSNSASGTAGMVLQSTGSGFEWVATSTLGISGSGGDVGGVYGINAETLAGNKTLTAGTDEIYQYLNPNGAHREITLDTASASAGDRFVVRNNGTYAISYYLNIKQGATDLEYIYVGGLKEFIFDGANWVSAENGTGENDLKQYNISIGGRSRSEQAGVAIGYQALGYKNGTAVGYLSQGQTGGTAVGYESRGESYGSSLGAGALGYTYGASIGYGSVGHTYGVAFGYTAVGYSNGVAIGYRSRGMNQGVAIGYDAGRNISTTGNLGNIVIGYQAGDNITSGSKNIVIGYNIDAPSATSANTLNIGNLLFGTGIDGTGTTLSSGNIGIGTSTPYAKLSLVDTTADNTDDVFVISTSTSGAIFKVQGSGEVYADGSFNSTGADYAEYYYTKDLDLESGELVCVDIERENAVKRCENMADGNLMGIVSSEPSIVGNSKEYYQNNPSYVVVGMLGQVPAFVSDENGAVRPGDSLTSASKPGTAMRASAGDPTVGVALEKLESGTDKINVLISRKNKSITVEEIEGQITDRIANMEIEDEVNILISGAIDNLNLLEEIKEVVDPKILAINDTIAKFEKEKTIEINNLGEELASLSDKITELQTSLVLIQDDLNIFKNNISIDSEGNVGIGNNNPIFNLHVVGAVGANSFAQVLGDKISFEDENLLDGLDNIDLSDPNSLPFEVLTNNGRAVDLFKMNAYLLNIVKLQQDQINSITHPGISLDSIAFSAGDNLEINNLSVWGKAYFGGMAKFEKEIVFGKDSAGQVLILPGDDQAYVGFEEAYLYNPIVSLTLASRAILDSYYISEASSTGFAIKIEPVLDQEVLFNWQAISVDDLQIKKSREELQVLEAEEGQIEAESDNSVGLDLVDENTEDVFQDEENLEELEENIGEQDFSGEELAPEADENQDIENIDDSENNDYISEESDLEDASSDGGEASEEIEENLIEE